MNEGVESEGQTLNQDGEREEDDDDDDDDDDVDVDDKIWIYMREVTKANKIGK